MLSETLGEHSMQTLSTMVISNLFPGLYREWTLLKRDIRDIFWRELSNRQNVVFRDIANKVESMREVLHEVVVENVVALFPYVTPTVFGLSS